MARNVADSAVRIAVRWTPLAALVLIAFLIAATPVLFDRQAVEALYRDPNATASQPFYYGLFSYMTAVAWIAAAGVAFFTLRVQHGQGDQAAPHFGFLFLISAMFGIDDLFMVHDGYVLAVGLSETLVYVLYLLVVAVWVITERKAILSGPFHVAVLAGALTGATIVIDQAAPWIEPAIESAGGVPFRIIIEDTAKLAGAIAWLCYVALSCERAVAPAAVRTRSI